MYGKAVRLRVPGALGARPPCPEGRRKRVAMQPPQQGGVGRGRCRRCGGWVEDWDEVGNLKILELVGIVLEAVDANGAEPGGVRIVVNAVVAESGVEEWNEV